LPEIVPALKKVCVAVASLKLTFGATAPPLFVNVPPLIVKLPATLNVEF
jgi:hypothetical protein